MLALARCKTLCVRARFGKARLRIRFFLWQLFFVVVYKSCFVVLGEALLTPQTLAFAAFKRKGDSQQPTLVLPFVYSLARQATAGDTIERRQSWPWHSGPLSRFKRFESRPRFIGRDLRAPVRWVVRAANEGRITVYPSGRKCNVNRVFATYQIPLGWKTRTR